MGISLHFSYTTTTPFSTAPEGMRVSYDVIDTNPDGWGDLRVVTHFGPPVWLSAKFASNEILRCAQNDTWPVAVILNKVKDLVSN
jgi:hypothetical protein